MATLSERSGAEAERRGSQVGVAHRRAVNEAYGLTPEEVELMWATAPPGMPRFWKYTLNNSRMHRHPMDELHH